MKTGREAVTEFTIGKYKKRTGGNEHVSSE